MKEKLYRQFGHPQGLLGWLVGWAMAFENRDRINWALDNMELESDDIVLEIGFGPGISIERIAKVAKITYGLEVSDLMIKQASRRNKKAIRNGSVALYHIDHFEYEIYYGAIDKILAINVALFWDDFEKELQKYLRFLKPNGLFQLVFEPHWIKSKEKVISIKRFYEVSFKRAGYSINNSELFENKKGHQILIKARKVDDRAG